MWKKLQVCLSQITAKYVAFSQDFTKKQIKVVSKYYLVAALLGAFREMLPFSSKLDTSHFRPLYLPNVDMAPLKE